MSPLSIAEGILLALVILFIGVPLALFICGCAFGAVFGLLGCIIGIAGGAGREAPHRPKGVISQSEWSALHDLTDRNSPV